MTDSRMFPISIPLALALARLAALATLAALCLGVPARAQAPLEVDARASIAVWPAVSLLREPGPGLSVEQVLAQGPGFDLPAGTPGNLGRIDQTVWLRIPLRVAGTQGTQRILEIDYPSLNRVDLYLVHDGRVVSQQRLGNELRLDERPLPSRTHAAPLWLAPGEHELLLRVHSRSSMVLPMTLRTPEAFTAQESRAQILQGVIAGLSLGMLLYSLSHWIMLRDPMFLAYALMLAGNVVFTLSYFGIGAQYLWPDSPRLSTQVAPLAVMVAVAAGARFMHDALALPEISRPAAVVMRLAGAGALAGIATTVLGLIDYRTAQTLVTVLGLVVTTLVLPVAFVRTLRGERVALLMLLGWAFYACGAVTMAGLLRGHVQPSLVNQLIYPLSMMVEMSAWMGVLGLRVHAIHRSADRTRVESETLRSLAHTDALTGLPNRRGLNARLEAGLRQCAPRRLLAVYLVDLDGFKAVNDEHGHDTGDALLVAVGQRLQAQLRGSDVVARLGGDEFVVVASSLADEGVARAVGQKMLAAFDSPIDAGGHRCRVGLTIGYALAPLDATDARDLLKCADAAMYAGKQAGRHRVERGARLAVNA
jgi:diguanylate cyclase (GGDEF)-like protein